MAEQSYKYRREDFSELPVTLNHLTIYLNFLDGFVEATNLLDITAIQPLNLIELDAKDLEIVQVEWVEDASGGKEPVLCLDYDYLENKNKLVVKLPRGLQSGDRFLVRTVTRCVPSDRLLEGIYKDTTPPGAPQQYISQCQQWGFQRIMPIFDDCRAKCTMTTTLEADARYTHLISNGNISRKLNPGGKPIVKPGDPSRQVITYENPVPMAPYLFLVAAGTWDVLSDAVTYESGRTVQLEYLVPPGRVNDARIPMEILKQAVLWVRKTQDYEYMGETYRTICMNKSNFGGMENVGNTTVVTDAALIDEHTLDRSLMYAHAVIVHEFEHNQCGSETTMETPFDVWLNEAYTVDVERAFMADVFDPAFVRLTQVDSIRSPLLGPLSIEDGGRAGRIVREGFDDPDDLIDGVTYVKAAEVIRMLRLVVGAETFRAGKNLYFSRYRDSNANTDQFFECFKEVSGRSLDLFKKSWLYRIGYPRVVAGSHYDSARSEYHIDLRQESATTQPPFHLPLEVALVDGEGRFVPGTDQVFEFTQETSRLTFPNISKEPAFASLNRDCSFYGAFRQENASPETLALQVRLDTNAFNRVEAMRRLTDRERINLLMDPGYVIDQQWIRLYGEILGDRSLPAALKAYFIRIEEQPLDREYCTWYRELVVAREKLMLVVNQAYLNDLKDAFHQVDTYRPRQSLRDGIEDRILKHVILDLIAIDDSSNSHRLIMDHYRSATTAADRVAALLALNRSSAPERREILEQAYDTWHTHLSGYGNYLAVIGAGTRDDVFDMIGIERKRPSFDITQPTWARALFLSMASNNKMVWTDRGIQWVADTIIELSRINAFTAGRLLNTFQHARKLKPDLQSKVIAVLEAIVRAVPEEISPSLHGQAKAYLE
jgi:aminopeptidase N